MDKCTENCAIFQEGKWFFLVTPVRQIKSCNKKQTKTLNIKFLYTNPNQELSLKLHYFTQNRDQETETSDRHKNSIDNTDRLIRIQIDRKIDKYMDKINMYLDAYIDI